MILKGILLVIGGIVVLLVLLILLLSLVPLRFVFEYIETGFLIELRVLFLKIPLLRRETEEEKGARLKKKEAKEAKKKKKTPKEEGEPKKTDYPALISLILKVLEEFTRKENLPIDHLWLDVTVGGEDPAATGMLFGAGHGLLGALWPLVERFFHVKDREIRTAVDFTIPSTRVDYFYAVLPLPLNKALGVALRVLLWYSREKKNQGIETKPQQTSNEQREAA